ncbi:ATP-binding protein [Clostridium sp.]|uniref:ATP-binding protein n=1 Tax=Clostridium sp. TaxID=1506 RepID=UPI0039F61A6F
MLLPKNERREKKIDVNPDMWLYADSYVGKSTFVDKFDDLLFLNTDGNTDNTTSPVIKIADEVIYEGRLKKVKMAWEVFLDAVTELEKKENTFKRVCIDLVEDLYEHCRLYNYKKLGIDHEQDAGFGKGWDMVRTEFLSAMKRLKNLGYQIIYVSKELNI